MISAIAAPERSCSVWAAAALFALGMRKKWQFYALPVQSYRSTAEAIQVTLDAVSGREREGLLLAMGLLGFKEGLILSLHREEVLPAGRKKIIVKPAWRWMLEGA